MTREEATSIVSEYEEASIADIPAKRERIIRALMLLDHIPRLDLPFLDIEAVTQ